MSEREFEESARLFASGQISRRRFINRMVGAGVGVAAAVAFADVTAAGAWNRWKKGGWGHSYGHHYGHTYGRPGHYGKPCNDHVYGGHKPPKHDWPPAGHKPPQSRADFTRSFWAKWGKRKP
jgi:hypothetical protein